MKEPIKAGDLAEVINGLLGEKSPNLGLIVKVLHMAGEHSLYGRIWACDAEFATRGQPGAEGIPPNVVEFAQDWLRKIEPPPLPAKTQEKKLVLTD